jgi:hypothetical protein
MLDLDLFSFGNDIMTREVLECEPLELFRELYREEGPEALPPVVVFHDADDVFWVADGHYRIVAARDALSKNGPRVLPADVREGTKRDAILFACGANAQHGQPLAAHEKRIVVRRLLKDAEWSQWSDRQIARRTGTSHVFVGGMRKALEQEAAASGSDYQIATPTRTVQRGSMTYQMHTANIGHAQSAPIVPASKIDDDDQDNGMEAIITEGLDELMDAWREASHAARRTFRDWVLARPIEDYGPVTPSEETQRNSAVIAQVCAGK